MPQGVCKYCGCTEDNACILEVGDPDEEHHRTFPCAWVDPEQTICSGCLDQVDELTLAHLVTAEMAQVPTFEIKLEAPDAWALAVFLQEAIAAHGSHDAATNPTLYAAAQFAQRLDLLLLQDRPAMGESLNRSWRHVEAEYESVVVPGAAMPRGEVVSKGGIIIP